MHAMCTQSNTYLLGAAGPGRNRVAQLDQRVGHSAAHDACGMTGTEAPITEAHQAARPAAGQGPPTDRAGRTDRRKHQVRGLTQPHDADTQLTVVDVPEGAHTLRPPQDMAGQQNDSQPHPAPSRPRAARCCRCSGSSPHPWPTAAPAVPPSTRRTCAAEKGAQGGIGKRTDIQTSRPHNASQLASHLH